MCAMCVCGQWNKKIFREALLFVWGDMSVEGLYTQIGNMFQYCLSLATRFPKFLMLSLSKYRGGHNVTFPYVVCIFLCLYWKLLSPVIGRHISGC